MLFPVSASDPVPVLEGMDEDMGFSLPPVLAELKEEEEDKEEKESKEESAPRPQPRRQVCTHSNTYIQVYSRLTVLFTV